MRTLVLLAALVVALSTPPPSGATEKVSGGLLLELVKEIDLAVVDAWPTGPLVDGTRRGQGTVFVAQIKNLGTRPSPASRLAIACRARLLPKLPPLFTVEVPVGPVAAGGQVYLTWPTAPSKATWRRGAYIMDFRVDPADAIAEVDETNDRLALAVDVLARAAPPPPRANLVVASIAVTPQKPVAGDDMGPVLVTLRNDGPVAARACVVAFGWFGASASPLVFPEALTDRRSEDVPSVGWLVVGKMEPLAGGATKTFTFAPPTNPLHQSLHAHWKQGSHRFACALDRLRQVVESNETDNQGEVAFELGPPGAPGVTNPATPLTRSFTLPPRLHGLSLGR